jgi:hypothetical protein
LKRDFSVDQPQEAGSFRLKHEAYDGGASEPVIKKKRHYCTGHGAREQTIEADNKELETWDHHGKCQRFLALFLLLSDARTGISTEIASFGCLVLAPPPAGFEADLLF